MKSFTACVSAMLLQAACLLGASVRSFTAVNRVLTGRVYRTIAARDWMQCLRACQAEHRCVSYNYHKSSTADHKACNLNTQGINECCKDDNLVFAEGFVFHQLKPLQVERKCSQEKGNWLTRKVFKNCKEVMKDHGNASGLYPIDPDGRGAFDAYCDQTKAGGGWTVFQRRLDGSVEFFRPWSDYKNGFGYLTGEFWLGLDKIHRLTSKAVNSELRVEVEAFGNETAFATYMGFRVDDEDRNFALHVESYSGTAGDSLDQHKRMPFTTRDKGHGDCDANCAQMFHGAWWYADTMLGSNLNGRYYNSSVFERDGVVWLQWRGFNASLKATEMKLRVGHE